MRCDGGGVTVGGYGHTRRFISKALCQSALSITSGIRGHAGNSPGGACVGERELKGGDLRTQERTDERDDVCGKCCGRTLEHECHPGGPDLFMFSFTRFSCTM